MSRWSLVAVAVLASGFSSCVRRWSSARVPRPRDARCSPPRLRQHRDPVATACPAARAVGESFAELASLETRLAESFAELASLETRLAAIDARAVPTLRRFYDAELGSFALEPGVTKNFSVTSSAVSLTTLLAMPARSAAADEFAAAGPALAASTWRNDDLLQVPLVVSALVRLAARGNADARGVALEASKARLRDAVQALLERRPRLRDWRRQPLSCYLIYWLTVALLDTIDPAHDAQEDFQLLAFLDIDRADVGLALQRSFEVSRDELCRQLAYATAGDAEAFDATKLAYSLATYATVAAARERVSTCAASARVEAPNMKLCALALGTWFDEQGEDGSWSAGQKIFIRSRRSFDVGNAFVFAPDTVATILALPLPTSLFRPHLAHIERMTGWLERNDVGGWRSNHLEAGGVPLAWSTAQGFRCVAASLGVVRELLNEQVLAEFGGRPARPADDAPFRRLLDSDLPGRSLKDVIMDRIIAPRRPTVDPVAAPPLHSAVFFGPPGTAKTTTSESVATALGYGFVVIDTACFLQDGIANIASRIAYVFDRLKRLEKCVPAAAQKSPAAASPRARPRPRRRRESPRSTRRSFAGDPLRRDRGVLLGPDDAGPRDGEPYLDDGHVDAAQRPEKCGTVHLLHCDEPPGGVRLGDRAAWPPRRLAVHRHAELGCSRDSSERNFGRVDVAAARILAAAAWILRRYPSAQVKRFADTVDDTDAVAAFEAFLQTNWDSDLLFFNYMESERFRAAAVATLAETGTLDALGEILADHARVSILRDDAVRAEFVENLALTRL